MLGAILAALADLRCGGADARAGLEYAQRAVEATREAEPWRAAQARLALAYCQARGGKLADTSTLAADLALLHAHWPAAGPFVARAEAQARAVHAGP
jgi:putative hemolysin